MGCEWVQLQWIDPGVSISHIARCLEDNGIRSVSVQDFYELVRENPYILCDEVEGIGFKTADRLALSLGVDTLIPPGNFDNFSFAVEHIDECLANPLNDADLAFLNEKRKIFRGKEFF